MVFLTRPTPILRLLQPHDALLESLEVISNPKFVWAAECLLHRFLYALSSSQL